MLCVIERNWIYGTIRLQDNKSRNHLPFHVCPISPTLFNYHVTVSGRFGLLAKHVSCLNCLGPFDISNQVQPMREPAPLENVIHNLRSIETQCPASITQPHFNRYCAATHAVVVVRGRSKSVVVAVPLERPSLYHIHPSIQTSIRICGSTRPNNRQRLSDQMQSIPAQWSTISSESIVPIHLVPRRRAAVAANSSNSSQPTTAACNQCHTMSDSILVVSTSLTYSRVQ